MGCSANDPNPFPLSLSKSQTAMRPRLIEARAEFIQDKRKGGGISVARHPPGRWYHFC